MSTTENNKAVVLEFLEEVINQNRMDRADELVVEDLWSSILCRVNGKGGMV
jgi:predicted SnoaL-like aldol condensation-catalyzing enzyme